MTRTQRKITLKDIAEEAGVSLTAASMYINGKAKKYHLSDAACERIRLAVKKMQYMPNIHARAIASKRTLLIGTIVSSHFESSFWLNIFAGIEETVARDNYHMVLSVSHDSAEKELRSIKFMLNKGIDGLLINPSTDFGDNLDYLRELGREMPVVTVNRQIPGLSGAYNNNSRGGEMATAHLLKLGHRKIAYVGDLMANRARAYSQLLRQNSLEPRLFAGVGEFMETCADFTAVFCFSDYVALEIYHEAAARGVNIPNDISVVGYDNMDFTEFTRPRLTTIEQQKKAVGVKAAEIMLQSLNREIPAAPPEQVEFMPKLIPGESVASLEKINQKD